MVDAKKILLLSGLVLMGILVITILPKSRNGDEGWIYYGKSEERTCYYNVHTVTLLAGGNISLRTREMYGETGEVKRNMWRTQFGNLIDEKDTFTHADRLLEIDCSRREFRILRAEERNTAGETFILYNNEETIHPILAGSTDEKLYGIVCQANRLRGYR
jgi:hypothetical protein